MDVLHTPKNFLDDLMVVLVIYKMEISKSPAFSSLTSALQSMNQKTSIFIYDNSQDVQTHTRNENWVITYQHNAANPGVSKAYNKGFEFAKSHNKKWLLLADQDTVFPINTFEQYQIAIEKLTCLIIVPRLVDQTGIVSPLKFYFGGGQRQNGIQANQRLSLKEYFFHNSGLLVSIEEFEKAGKYDENLSLDFSDFSFVHRLRKRNFFFAVANITADHPLASTSSANLDARLVRFSCYLKAGQYFRKNYQPSDGWLAIRFFLRAVKLAFQYRNFQFLVLYFR